MNESAYSAPFDAGRRSTDTFSDTPAIELSSDEEQQLKTERIKHGVRTFRIAGQPTGHLFSKIYSYLPSGPFKSTPSLRRRSLRQLIILLSTAAFLLLFFGKHEKHIVEALFWRYNRNSQQINAKQITKILDLNESKFNSLRLDKTDIPPSDFILQNVDPNSAQRPAFDPRLAPALYISEITSQLIENAGALDESFSLPFSWSDWVNIDRRLAPSDEYVKENGCGLESCNRFAEANGIPKGGNCKDLSAEEIEALPDKLYPHFKVTGTVAKTFSRDGRVVYAGSYLYHSFPAPTRVMFLDNDKNLAVSLQVTGSEKNKPVFPQLAKKHMERYPESKESMQISLHEEVERMENKLSSSFLTFQQNAELFLDAESTRVVRIDTSNKLDSPLQVKMEDFEWDRDSAKVKDKMEQFIKDADERCGGENHLHANDPTCDKDRALTYQLYKRTVKTINDSHQGRYAKHFMEANHTPKGSDNGAHFDWRFFTARTLTEYESTSELHKLIRSWLRMARILNIDTWIAHGTLLGYYFNGLMMAWDFDHDVHVTYSSLVRLARNYDKTLVIDVTRGMPDTPQYGDEGMGGFYIDVGDSYFYREMGNGMNAIDARFIDIHSGLFIDITALGQVKSEPMKASRMPNRFKIEWEGLEEQYGIERSDFAKLVQDRNNHYYTAEELSPLIPTLYEGEMALVPQKFLNILGREYKKYRSKWTQENHTWRTRYMSWISDDICSKWDREGNSCSSNAQVTLNNRWQRQYILKHVMEIENLEAAQNSIIERSPASVNAYPRLLRPDVHLMEIAD